jgi:hypothetical protein
MVNKGTITDYYGPYSPYEDIDQGDDNFCTHLFYCTCCHNDRRIAVPLETLSCHNLAE